MIAGVYVISVLKKAVVGMMGGLSRWREDGRGRVRGVKVGRWDVWRGLVGGDRRGLEVKEKMG